jgi:hypothetical protein
MIRIASLATQKVMSILAASQGVPAAIAALGSQEGIALPAITPPQIVAQNATPELWEESTASNYPMIYVYCSKMTNELKEKFRTFSGDVQITAEARVSQNQLTEIDANLGVYIDALTQVLNQNRGDWGDGIVYGGGYEVAFGTVKRGGQNFLQTAKVSFSLEVSTD